MTRDIPNTLQIRAYLHCGLCLEEWKALRGISPAEYSKNSVGMTELGFQVWCRRHECNVCHIDFQGQVHPANQTIEDKKMTTERKIETRIVGEFKNPITMVLFKHLPAGTPLLLKREPTNPVDQHAIAVYCTMTPEMRAAIREVAGAQNIRDDEPQPIGYIPRADNTMLIGKELTGCVRSEKNKTSIIVSYIG